MPHPVNVDDPLLNNISYADCQLVLHLRTDALAYAVYSRVHNRFVALHDMRLERNTGYKATLDALGSITVFEKLYRQVLIAVDERLHTLVPRALYDITQPDTYLHLMEPHPDEATAKDQVAAADVMNIYSLPAALSNKLGKIFRNPVVLATSSVLLQQCLKEHRQRKDDLIWACLENGRLDIVSLEKGRLVFGNHFSVRAPEDLSYYLLAAAEQSGFNTDTAVVHFVTPDAGQYLLAAQKYFRTVELGSRPAAFHYSQLMDSLPTAAYYTLFSLNGCE